MRLSERFAYTAHALTMICFFSGRRKDMRHIGAVEIL